MRARVVLLIAAVPLLWPLLGLGCAKDNSVAQPLPTCDNPESELSQTDPGESTVRTYIIALKDLQTKGAQLEGQFKDVCNAIMAEAGVPPANDIKSACNAFADRVKAANVNAPPLPPGPTPIPWIHLKSPEVCAASLSAQLDCLAHCGGGGDCDPKVKCDHYAGECDGACTGSCEQKGQTAKCAGDCRGGCTMTGTLCNGECTGTCTTPHWQGACDVACDDGFIGSCGGTCTGTCDGQLINQQPTGGDAGADAGGTKPAPTGNDGNCHGVCTGACSSKASGQCATGAAAGNPCTGNFTAGPCADQCTGACDSASSGCDGACNGSCFVASTGTCAGVCHGACATDMKNAYCAGTLDCGANIQCRNACIGVATASLTCTPPAAVDVGGAGDPTLYASLKKHAPDLAVVVEEARKLKAASDLLRDKTVDDFRAVGAKSQIARVCVDAASPIYDTASKSITNAYNASLSLEGQKF